MAVVVPRRRPDYDRTLGTSELALEGPELDEHNARIERLYELHAEADEALNELQAADVAVWDVRKDQVVDAMDRLEKELENESNVEVRVENQISDID